MTPNKRDLKAYARFDGTGRIVPGSLVLRRTKPKVGTWTEVQAYECCVPTSLGEPLIMQILPWNIGPDIYEFAFGMRTAIGNSVKGTIEWGDGTSESFDLSAEYGTSYIFHDYATNQFTPQTVKVYFTSLSGFENLEIGEGDLTGDLLSVSNLQGVFAGSSIIQIDADGQDNLVSLDVSNLPIEEFYALECPTLHYVNVSGCTNLYDTELFDDDIYQLDFTGCSSLQTALVFLNANLNTLIIDGCPNLTLLDAGDCALDEQIVNNILVNLDDNGLSNGAVYIGGGTSAAPTGAGATAASNLIGKGWTVSTNL